VPLKKIEVRVKLLKEIEKAIQEAKKAGITNPIKLVKKTLDSKKTYEVWKQRKTK
jgi:hypothetical protein